MMDNQIKAALRGDKQARADCTAAGVLLPCPFCGAATNLSADGGIVAWHDQGCFFNLLEAGEVDMTQQEIAASFVPAWNARASTEVCWL